MFKLRYVLLLWFAVMIGLGLFSNIRDLSQPFSTSASNQNATVPQFVGPGSEQLFSGNDEDIQPSSPANPHSVKPCCKKSSAAKAPLSQPAQPPKKADSSHKDVKMTISRSDSQAIALEEFPSGPTHDSLWMPCVKGDC